MNSNGYEGKTQEEIDAMELLIDLSSSDGGREDGMKFKNGTTVSDIKAYCLEKFGISIENQELKLISKDTGVLHYPLINDSNSMFDAGLN